MSNRRHHRNDPAWPTGDDPDAAKWPRDDEPQERTGFWSPLWEDDEDEPAPRPARQSAHHAGNGNGNGHSNGNAGNGHPGNGAPAAATQWLPAQPAPPARAQRQPARPVPPGPNGANGANGPTVRLPNARPGGLPPRGPRDNSEDPTELLPHTSDPSRREPDLLTHRDPAYDEDADLLEDSDRPLTEDERRNRRKKIWRRVRRTMYVLLVLMTVGPVLAFFITYQFVTVPSPEGIKASQNQVVTMQYADGSELTKIVPEDGNRTMVTWEELQAAPQVLNAVFAAEDATFMTNSGFDISGVLRAGWNQVTGGEGGGSTITQQYIKMATGKDEQTLTRKGVEVVSAYKMNRTYSKEAIITAYLNTIYFGRNAYGIAAAAKAYYGVEFKALTPSQSALLAGMIQSPGRFKDDAYMQRRWNYVMDQLVGNNWLPAAQRKAEQFPTPVPYEQTRTKALTGPRGMIQRAAFAELADGPLKLTEDEIQRNGFTIVTTIDPQAQTLAEQAVTEGMKGQPDNLRPALVAVDPNSGAIKAYYGGADAVGTDWAATEQEPGSSFKPFDAVALLKTGKGLGESYDGSSPRKFPGMSQPIRNSGNAQCNPCTVAEAMKRSINTVFYEIALDVGTGKVAEAAHEAGITASFGVEAGAAPSAGIAIGGDKTQVSTTDMASAYATFAARGVHREAHIVSKVLNPDGSPYWEASPKETQAFDDNAKTNEKIARNITESLLPVPKFSNIACADGRLCAGKTGTHQLGETGKNAKAWMVGYTPQLSTAVSLSGDKGSAIENAQGGDIFGARVPGAIWKKFMDSYHKTFKLPKQDFGRYEAIGKEAAELSSSSKKPPSETQQPTTTERDRGRDRDNATSDTPTPTTTTTTTSRRPGGLPTLPGGSDAPGPGGG